MNVFEPDGVADDEETASDETKRVSDESASLYFKTAKCV